MKYFKYLFTLSLIIPVLTFAGAPFVARAQGELPAYQHVQLWVYPEYDDPRLLIMMQGNISGVDLPAEVTFLVPSTAEMYSAGSLDSSGSYTGGPPDRVASDIPGWDKISYQVTTNTFRVEYYDSIIFGTVNKTISYEFRTLHDISNLSVVVQEPLGSTDFTVTPESSKFADTGGFTSYLYNYTDITPDTVLPFEISYTRSETAPSTSIADSSSGSSDYSIIIIIVVVLVAGVIGWFLWNRKGGSSPRSRGERRRANRNSKSKAAVKQKTSTGQSKSRFCPECGNQVDGNYKYCPNCGAAIPR